MKQKIRIEFVFSKNFKLFKKSPIFAKKLQRSVYYTLITTKESSDALHPVPPLETALDRKASSTAESKKFKKISKLFSKTGKSAKNLQRSP